MATKKDLLKDARAAGLVPEGASEDDYSVADLEGLLDRAAAAEGEAPAWEGSLSDHKTPPAPDGHDFYKNLLDPDA
jgi:hypothetical protein